MNLYSNKQKWKIFLLLIALLLVGASLLVSNEIVQKVAERERDRVKQWADAIKKKAELVQLTDRTFLQLRDKERAEMEMWIDATKELSKPIAGEIIPDYSLPLKIIKKNKDIPVILMDQDESISGHINLDFDTSLFRQQEPTATPRTIVRMFDDSLRQLAHAWKRKNPAFTIEVYDGLFMTYVYDDSKEITKLEKERDSLIQSFNAELIENEGMVPVVLVAAKTDSIIASNMTPEQFAQRDTNQLIQQLKQINQPIPIEFSDEADSLLLYDDSPELKRLQYFPYIQFGIIGLFIFIGYLIFSTFRKAEQNQVWAGMAKETAHQLGTPLSSLMAWIELLPSYQLDPMVVAEMQKDVKRLETVTNRFSKIGSTTKLEENDLVQTVEQVVDYLRTRISGKISLQFQSDEPELWVRHNPSLLEWVIENIVKNAVDAMENTGMIRLHLRATAKQIYIDIHDTGKGIPAKQFKTIFQPGFTTKKRGWGLGLSLVKRIINEYHRGKVFVVESELGKGTTFRVQLPRERNPRK